MPERSRGVGEDRAAAADWNAWLALMVGRTACYGGQRVRIRAARLTPDRRHVELVCRRPARRI